MAGGGGGGGRGSGGEGGQGEPGVRNLTYLKANELRWEGQPARLVHDDSGCPISMSYDTAEKAAVRKTYFDLAESTGNKNLMVTLAGHEGLCVKEAIRREWKRVVNVENEDIVLKEYWKLGLPSEDYLQDMASFYAEFDDEDIDLLNLDFTGYLSVNMARLLSQVNARRDSRVVVVTMQDHKNFRNDGVWVDAMVEKYDGNYDPVGSCMEDLMWEYRLAEHVQYRNSTKGARSMRVFMFVRKP